MTEQVFHHALNFDRETCVGCSHCMRVCPTQAIRVREGKAHLIPNRCIDCGECYRVCPVEAIKVEQDDFDLIFKYRYRLAMVPGVLLGQLSEDINARQVYSILLEMGFTHVCEAEVGSEILKDVMADYIDKHQDYRPLISTFCPAVVRLIQVKFPSLVNHIIPMKSPLDIAGLYYRKRLEEQGARKEDIGLFYITPCAAKIAAIKSPVGESSSVITGVINMDYAYNRALFTQKQGQEKTCQLTEEPPLSKEAVLWSLTNGEADNMPGRSLSIDGINNVIEFLENLENEDLTDIDFLELRSCDESCAGGILTSTNRFLTAERLRKRAETIPASQNSKATRHHISQYSDFIKNQITIESIPPRSMLKLDDNISGALGKMKKMNELQEVLPNVDCGICGSPSCRSLAEDIVREEAEISDCIFIQRILEQKGTFEFQESVKIMKRIWGKEKLDTNIDKQ